MNPERRFSSDSAPRVPAPGTLAAAAAWVARRDAGLTPAEFAQLQAWLAADPAHRAAFQQSDAQRTEVDWALHAGVVDEVLAGLEQRALLRRRRRRVLTAASAASVALLLVAGFLGRDPRRADPAPDAPGANSVTILEPRRLQFSDGSSAELREGADLTFDFSGAVRRVNLQRGAAHFQVAHDAAHPFVVHSGDLEVRAVGTAFSVQLDARNIEVVVTEGRVAVARSESPAAPATLAPATPVAPLLLDAGHGIVAERASSSEVAPQMYALPAADLGERLAWRVPRFDFVGTPLVEVVRVMNRHNRVQFVLADPALEKLQLSGIVGADKVEALQDMLEAGFGIRAERTGDRIILRR